MNIILQIYWITVIASASSQILRMKLNKELDPFKAMKDMQEQIDSMSEKWVERTKNLIQWMVDNAPFSLYMVIATLSVMPIFNLMYFYANVKGVIADTKG